ncbi:Pentatricopeptide repeat-containing protein mitochondrial [Dissostichus eleginoides]|uniref:Pentatricopeptide repeat-containing protein mitochondrial n=1 Tax=Dissostichus eleginoides TaxID=100907 RepID=A0AAD9EVW9_DISEL|nr:Pentatricopeptide repeat-containing protein mitochondrial [Dissostichus eleginoides]
MDIRTVVTISTLLLMTAESNQSTPGPNITEPPHTYSSTRGCSCPPIPSSPAPPTGLLSITWRSQCEGDVQLIFYHPANSSSPVCHGSEKNILNILRSVCEHQRGCTNSMSWVKGEEQQGQKITENGAEEISCETLRVRCPVEVLPDVPTVRALQNRLSERRQNRWIGPTQSHSALERLAVSDSREPSSNRNSDYNF